MSADIKNFIHVKDWYKTRTVLHSDPYNLDHRLCIVQSDHWGGILNILPIVKHFADIEGEAPYLSVPLPFVSIFDAISYAKRIDFDTDRTDAIATAARARQRFARVICLQPGDIENPKNHRCQSFTQEQWRLGYCLDHFSDESWPLVFDKADRYAPGMTVGEIAVNVTSAITNPIGYGSSLLALLKAAFPTQISDIGSVTVPHIWDLVPVMDASRVVVSVDTGTLHLAAASRTPLIALVGDESSWRTGQDWRNCIPRYRCPFRFRYPEVRRNPGLMVDAIERVTGIKSNPAWMNVSIVDDPVKSSGQVSNP